MYTHTTAVKAMEEYRFGTERTRRARRRKVVAEAEQVEPKEREEEEIVKSDEELDRFAQHPPSKLPA